MSETISRPFTFVKDGVYYFSRRIPKELRDHYASPRIAYSLRTKSPKIAEARARRAADQLDEYWYHLRYRNVELPGKHMLRLHQRENRNPRCFVSVSKAQRQIKQKQDPNPTHGIDASKLTHSSLFYLPAQSEDGPKGSFFIDHNEQDRRALYTQVDDEQVKELHAKIGELAVANGTGGFRGPTGATVRP